MQKVQKVDFLLDAEDLLSNVILNGVSSMNTIDTLSEELLKEFSFFKKTPPAVINKEFLNKIKNEKLKKRKVILNNVPLREIYSTYIDISGIRKFSEYLIKIDKEFKKKLPPFMKENFTLEEITMEYDDREDSDRDDKLIESKVLEIAGIKSENELINKFGRLGQIYENWYHIGGRETLSIETSSLIELTEKYLELEKILRDEDILQKTYKLYEKMSRENINKLIIKQYDGSSSLKGRAYEDLEYFIPQYVSDIIYAPELYMQLFREAVVKYKESLEEVIKQLYPLT